METRTVPQRLVDQAQKLYSGDTILSKGTARGLITLDGKIYIVSGLHSRGGETLGAQVDEVTPLEFYQEPTMGLAEVQRRLSHHHDEHGRPDFSLGDELRETGFRGMIVYVKGQAYVQTGRELDLVAAEEKPAPKQLSMF